MIELRKNAKHADCWTTRSIVTSLAAYSPVNAFCNENIMQKRYFKVTTLLSQGNTTEATHLSLYVQLVPVLRALMLIERIEKVDFFLRAYRDVAEIFVLNGKLLMRIFDDMLVDSDFIVKAQYNQLEALQVLPLIEFVFGWQPGPALFTSVHSGYLNIAEVFLMQTNIEEDNAFKLLLSTAINGLEGTDSVEMITLVMGYCYTLGSAHLIFF